MAIRTVKYLPDYDGGEVEVEWGPSLFERDATDIASHDARDKLMLTAAALTAAAMDARDERGAGKYIIDAYKALDFEGISLFSYPDNPYNLTDIPGIRSNDKDFAFSIAHQKMAVNGEETNIIAIIMRGTETMVEAVADLETVICDEDAAVSYKLLAQVYVQSLYPGFLLSGYSHNDFFGFGDFYGHTAYRAFLYFMNEAWAGLHYYANKHPGLMAGKTKYLIAGHSLGGAATNLLAAKMPQTDEWLGLGLGAAPKAGDIYAFTFGALNSLYKESVIDGFDHITNIYNYYDNYGPHGPGTLGAKPARGWESWKYKYGLIKDFQIDFSALFRNKNARSKNHIMPCYVNAIKANFDSLQAARLLHAGV